METAEPKPMTPAEKHYEALKRAQRAYYRRKNPNPKPRGRPKKIKVEEYSSVL